MSKIDWQCLVADCNHIWQTTPAHITHSNSGCPECYKNNVSKVETEWLDYLKIPNDLQHRKVILKINDKTIKPDGFDPDTNTIYEFYGDYWHGNPKTFKPTDVNPENKKSYGKLYKDTIKREKLIQAAGYKLIIIWESDWRKSKLKLLDI